MLMNVATFGNQPGNEQRVDVQGATQECKEGADIKQEDNTFEPESSAPHPTQSETSIHPPPTSTIQSPIEVSCSDNQSPLIPPEEVIPLPKVQIKRKRRRGFKSVLLTSTPHRIHLETQSAEKKKLEKDKKKKALERCKKRLPFPPKKRINKRSDSSSSSDSESCISLHNSSSDLDIS